MAAAGSKGQHIVGVLQQMMADVQATIDRTAEQLGQVEVSLFGSIAFVLAY